MRGISDVYKKINAPHLRRRHLFFERETRFIGTTSSCCNKFFYQISILLPFYFIFTLHSFAFCFLCFMVNKYPWNTVFSRFYATRIVSFKPLFQIWRMAIIIFILIPRMEYIEIVHIVANIQVICLIPKFVYREMYINKIFLNNGEIYDRARDPDLSGRHPSI